MCGFLMPYVLVCGVGGGAVGTTTTSTMATNSSPTTVFRLTDTLSARRPWCSLPSKGRPAPNKDAERLTPVLRLLPATFPYRVWHPKEDQTLLGALLGVVQRTLGEDAVAPTSVDQLKGVGCGL